jgi:hypothetical protein
MLTGKITFPNHTDERVLVWFAPRWSCLHCEKHIPVHAAKDGTVLKNPRGKRILYIRKLLLDNARYLGVDVVALEKSSHKTGVESVRNA